jgi:hypothetical protein
MLGRLPRLSVTEVAGGALLLGLTAPTGTLGSQPVAAMPAQPGSGRPPPRSRWSSFVAAGSEPNPRVLREEGNPDHRVRVEHNRDTILVHLSGEDGHGWTVLAVDRASRRWAVGEAHRQIDAARDAFERLYGT